VGEWTDVDPDAVFTIGRDGDLQVDENPYLHRTFLLLDRSDGLWWLTNAGSRLSATVCDVAGSVQAWLAPGARLPVVFAETTVLFTAGPTTYELTLVNDEPAFTPSEVGHADTGETTIGPVVLTDSQKALIVALSEPLLRRDGTGTSAIPSSRQAAERLGVGTDPVQPQAGQRLRQAGPPRGPGSARRTGTAGRQPPRPPGRACRRLAPGHPRRPRPAGYPDLMDTRP
jgi:hypothetical protein